MARTSPSEGEVLRSLGGIRDPQLRRSLLELGMVRSLRSRRGRVEISLALPTPNHPDRDELVATIDRAARGAGSENVRVDVNEMTDAERAGLRQTLVGDRPRGRRQQGAANPFAAPGSSTRVVGVSSGKGGVGKSSVTVNLAIALSKLGRQVAIMDADVYGFSVPGMLGIRHDPMVIDDLLIPPVAYGVACISIGFFVEGDQPVIWRGPMLHKALEQFLVDVHWGELDYLVLDMPPGTGDVALSMAEYLPKSEVLVVTTPQVAARRVAQRSALAARRLKLPVRGVIENMSWFRGDDGTRYEIFGRGGGAGLAEDLGVPLLGQVPLVPEIRSGGDVGLPVVVSEPEGEAANAFGNLAEQVEALGPARIYRKELTVR